MKRTGGGPAVGVGGGEGEKGRKRDGRLDTACDRRASDARSEDPKETPTRTRPEDADY